MQHRHLLGTGRLLSPPEKWGGMPFSEFSGREDREGRTVIRPPQLVSWVGAEDSVPGL